VLLEVPFPVLFNTWKHHAGALRARIAHSAQDGEVGLRQLAEQLVQIGGDLMDLYLGKLSPVEIADHVVVALKQDGRLALAEYGQWIEANGGYQVLTFAEDESRWVLRMGDEPDRYVHIHPARWAPQTLRVRANVLKTAILAVAYAAVHGNNPLDVRLINTVRQQFLGYSPIGRLQGDQGIRGVIEILGPRSEA
jgi:hypothetical protein